MTHSLNVMSEERWGRLIDKTMPSDRRCTLKEYLEGDNKLQVCVDKGSDNWEASFFEQLGEDQEQDEDDDKDQEQDHDSNEEVMEKDVEPPSPKVKSFKEAIEALEDVSQFLESRGRVQALVWWDQ